jgi:hypothetical protein
MTSPPTARGDQVIARQIIRRLIWVLRRYPKYVRVNMGYGQQFRDRIRALWEYR